MSNREANARMHVAQAYSRSISPRAREHLRAALRYLDDDTGHLVECPECGKLGVAERIAEHSCRPGR